VDRRAPRRGMPTPRWPAGLAAQVGRWLVDHGVDCRRIEVIGWLDRSPDAPGERVRFRVGPRAEGRREEERIDPCAP